jgi:hypothetical protein
MKTYLATQWHRARGHVERISDLPHMHKIADSFLVKAAVYLMRVLCFAGLIAVTSSLGAVAAVIGFSILPAAWVIIGVCIWIARIPAHS